MFWVDNCSGQNKNWFLFTALADLVNVPGITVETVTLKYFEPGHTFMSADSFHHKVEQAMKQKKRVEDFQDFVNVVEKCGKSLQMKCNDFYNYPKGVSQAKYASKKPKLENVQVAKFSRGSSELFWKQNHFDQEFDSALFLQRKYENKIGKNEFQPCNVDRGIKSSKKGKHYKSFMPSHEGAK